MDYAFFVVGVLVGCFVANCFSSLECLDKTNTDWCQVMRPEKSHFRFSNAPTDAEKWHRSQIQAARGDQVLLKKILEQFPFYLNFLDGDINFRNIHELVDVFIDDNTRLYPLTGLVVPIKLIIAVKKKHLAVNSNNRNISNKEKVIYEFQNKSFSLPNSHNSAKWKRATIAMLGYHAFTKEGEKYFKGAELGSVYIVTESLVQMWKELNTSQIENPFILIHANNENYGMLSTYLPNRTADWGLCCSEDEYAVLTDMLNHKKALMYLSNQHSNFTHPKLITLPRGIHLVTDVPEDINRKLIWDTMRNSVNIPKQQFAFSATSNAFFRVQIMNCIMKKFPVQGDIERVLFGEMNQTRLNPEDYYAKIANARVGFALPGLGYDTYRLWETLTMGSVAVLEKGIGLDKTLWRLPALLVDDFADVTPQLLREAYVEAIYRVDEFEFERLTQSYWYDMIGKVASMKSSRPLFKRFPPHLAEDRHFARPVVPFDCGPQNLQCGPGTKRTPAISC